MRIVVEDLRDQPVHLVGTVEVALEGGGETGGPVVRAPVAYDLQLVKQESSVRVEGRVEAVVEASCSRCAKRFPIAVDRRFSELFAAADDRQGVLRRELDGNDLDLDYYQGDAIDGLQLLAEQIFLELPMKILCAEDCKGLCPTCGADLNHIDCDCEANVDPRWASLKGLRDQF